MMVATLSIFVIMFIILFLQQLKFGAAAKSERLKRIESSPNFREGEFKNLSHTPALAEGISYARVFYEFFFRKDKRTRPAVKLPSGKVDLHTLDAAENVLVWFGHSSYFMQVDGKTVLADPVFSGHASPVKFTTKAFNGSDAYSAADMPAIDYLFLSHDHWDHLDYETVLALKPKIRNIITGLGVAAHLERWGFDMDIVKECDWNETVQYEDGFTFHTTPARHFSGRLFKRNQSLWISLVMQSPSFKIYMGGDSGYDSHFKAIGEQHGPFDLAILECGQYNEYWKYIHLLPEQVAQAGTDLKTKSVLPVHWGKFSLALHAWDDPIKRVTAEAEKQHIPLLTPMIGEKINLNNPEQVKFKKWWEGLE